MANIELTAGAIESLCNDERDVKPVLQVTEIRLVNTQNTMSTTERYRLLLSDGVYFQQAMLATKHNSLVKNGVLQLGSILRLFQFARNNIQERIIIIMMELEVIHEPCPQIGEPKPYVPPNANLVPSPVAHGHPQHGRPHAISQGPTYYQSEAGTLQQPKPEYGGQMQSYGMPSTINSNIGRYAVNNGPPNYPKSEISPGFSGNATGASSYGRFNNTTQDVSHAPPNSYARPQQPAYQHQSSMYVNRGPIAKNDAPARTIPISALNPYQGRWTIKARVTVKSELRHYNNPRGDGKVFSFDLLDSEGGEIRVTCFNAAADQFFDLIEVGKVYQISKGTLKPAQKNFNHLPNDHEMFLDATSLVEPCYDDDSRIPKVQFRFRPISDIEDMDNQCILDVIGVVTSISPTASIMRKNGTEVQKRNLQMKDMSGRSVELTMWGIFCNVEGQTLQNLCDAGNFPVLAVKGAKVSDFMGKTLGTISTSQLFIEPENPEAQDLKLWFAQEGRSLPSVSISREMTNSGKTDVRKAISQIKDENLGTSDKPDWITVCASLSFIKMDNFCYTACPIQTGDRQCSKKVTNNGDGKWRCDKCDQTVDECDYRYILQFQIQDHTGLTWVTAFQECGEELLGVSAKELFDLKYNQADEDKFQETIRAALFRKYIFKLKVKEETFSDEARVKSTVVRAERVNFVAESKSLSDLIHKGKLGDSTVNVKTENVPPNIGPNRSGINHTGFGMNPNSTAREMGNFNSNSAQYGNQYSGSGHGGGVYASCSSCGGTGHNSTNCPSIINSPRQQLGPPVNQAVSGGYGGRSAVQCFKCQNVGHFAKDCPGLTSVPPAYGGSNVGLGRYGGVSRQHAGGF